MRCRTVKENHTDTFEDVFNSLVNWNREAYNKRQFFGFLKKIPSEIYRYKYIQRYRMLSMHACKFLATQN